MILSIAIPTYNRPEKVKATILMLLPQVNNEAKIVIFDNHSDTNIQNYLAAQLGDDILQNITVIRHQVNIGADANFARCFELCDTEYVWLLGDDDKVEPDAVNKILAEIKYFDDGHLIGINFRSNCCQAKRIEPVVINSTSQFVNKCDDFGALLFLSASVYHRAEYLKYIRLAFWGAYTMASQLIPAMMAVSKGEKFVLSEKYIVTNVPEQDHDKGWSPVQLALGLSAILEAPVDYRGNDYKKFGKLLSPHFNCLYPLDAMFIIIRSVNNNIDEVDNYHIYLFKQVILKTFEFREKR